MNPTLRSAIYLWKSTFLGFLIGLDLAWLLTEGTWLDMRMHTGWLMPALALAGLGLGIFTALRPKQLARGVSSRNLGLLVLLLQVPVLTFLAWEDWRTLFVVPAAMVGDLLPGSPPASVINWGLLTIGLAGVPALFFDPDLYCGPEACTVRVK